MRNVGKTLTAGWAISVAALAGSVLADTGQLSRQDMVSFRLATTVATRDFDRISYNGEALFVAKEPAFTSRDVLSAESLRAGTILDMTLNRQAMDRLASAARAAGADRLASYIGSRLLAVALLSSNAAEGHTVLEGFASGQSDRLVDLLVREGVAFSGPMVSVVTDRAVARPGDIINADVFISGVAVLGAWEVALEVSGGDAGSVAVEDVTIDDTRQDFVFGPAGAIKITDPDLMRAAGVMMSGGVPADAPSYVASYRLRVSPDAQGEFNVNVATGDRTILRDSDALGIAYRPGSAAKLAVGVTRKEAVGR